LVAEEVQGRDEDDRQRLRDDLAQTEPVEEDGEPELVDEERDDRDDVEAHPLEGEAALLPGERPVPVPPVVRRRGDDERDRGRRVRAQAERRLVDGEVDDETGRADDPELEELDPVVRPAQRLDRTGGCRHAPSLARATAYAADRASRTCPSSSIQGSAKPPSASRREWRR